MAISRRYGNLRSLSRGIGSQIRRGEREKIISGNPSFDINESSEARRLRKIKNLKGRPGTGGEGNAADEALKKLFGPRLPKV